MFILRKRRKAHLRFLQIQMLLLSVLHFCLNAASLPCDDNRCKTRSCNGTGACICNLPDPSTILDGERPFLGGRFCDEEQIMCDGTNSFWCEHGANCEEIVHGENYSCQCPLGHAGVHCEHSGAPCGQIFCFHQAECLVEGDSCECPSDWRGSVDCSQPTRIDKGDSTDSAIGTLPHVETSSSNMKWLVVVLAISCSLGAIAGGVIYSKRFFKKKGMASTKFQQLSQMKMNDFLDDEEEDSIVLHNDGAHF